MRAFAVIALVVLALTGCDREAPRPATSSAPTPTASAEGPQDVDPTATLGTWLFAHGTTDGDKIDELGNFTITVSATGVEGGSICGRFVSARPDGALYPLEPAWEPNATGETSLCQPGPRAILSNFGPLSPTRLDETTLELADSTVSMTFTRIDTPSPIVSNWLLASAKDAKGKLPLASSAQQLDLRLDFKHHYVFFSGCNTGSGQWSGGEGALTLGTTSATLPSCTTKLTKLDKRYRAALAAITKASVTGGVLTLTGKKVKLTFAMATAG
jgi:heat shock protein HslJ